MDIRDFSERVIFVDNQLKETASEHPHWTIQRGGKSRGDFVFFDTEGREIGYIDFWDGKIQLGRECL